MASQCRMRRLELNCGSMNCCGRDCTVDVDDDDGKLEVRRLFDVAKRLCDVKRFGEDEARRLWSLDLSSSRGGEGGEEGEGGELATGLKADRSPWKILAWWARRAG